MANYQSSVEYGTLRDRSVEEVFRVLLADAPLLVSLFQTEDGVNEHKHEWLDDVKTPIQWTVDGAVDASATTTVTLDSNTGVKVGDILGFKASTGASLVQQAKVSAVDSGGADLTVEWLQATTNDLTDNAVAFLVSRAQAEGSDEDIATNRVPSLRYNFTQILRRDFRINRTTLQSKLYGFANASQQERDNAIMDLIDYHTKNQLADLMYELNNSIIHGFREERVDGGDNGTMGGLLSFIKAGSNSTYDASTGALSSTIINNAYAQSLENGANPAEMTVMLMHTRQARKLSAFNSSIIKTTREDTKTGSYIADFQSDLGGTNGGGQSTIVVDRSFPEDKIAIINPNDIKIKDMQEMMQEETTLKQRDARTFKLLGEKTLEFKNAQSNAMLIENLGL